MSNSVRIILIGNYLPDKQESMLRFAHMLDNGFRNAGFKSEVWQPTVLFGKKALNTNAGFGKWLGYLDKWVIFPIVLRWRLLGSGNLRQPTVRFHICDHSNAPYLKQLPIDQTSITCHDVLAIRGGLGHVDTYVTASRFGQILQRWILNSLSHAKRLAAVSQLTFDQLQALIPPHPKHKDWRVIHNAFNAEFWPMDARQASSLIKQTELDLNVPFLLHVGSGHPRKNRLLLLDMVAILGKQWQGNICFAGEALDSTLLEHSEILGLRQRIISIVKPDHHVLVALYSTCAAFVFPSYTEGFGWPVIEAQACGRPVIASNVAPMPEVSGGAALHAAPTDAQAFADAFLSLIDDSKRTNLIAAGLANCRRFELNHILSAYLELIM
ncbi:glycosyltransferase family 4 protein [Hymenobacter arizonensis]|uniref:Glycosyltransferase involved in cell wall bisynthesis n=1 Tax=Hymenobacter arizonensis TaxID=1227077 RepID=A0A1I6BRQ4_HYMAR|nr:glycosyltransferase family 1 protein [Hymenobacter arizonensis]SFQ83609.1 Glycosyltransferase involved in cell wall bisynthesis [Hymenobacter arizonensis]